MVCLWAFSIGEKLTFSWSMCCFSLEVGWQAFVFCSGCRVGGFSRGQIHSEFDLQWPRIIASIAIEVWSRQRSHFRCLVFAFRVAEATMHEQAVCCGCSARVQVTSGIWPHWDCDGCFCFVPVRWLSSSEVFVECVFCWFSFSHLLCNMFFGRMISPFTKCLVLCAHGLCGFGNKIVSWCHVFVAVVVAQFWCCDVFFEVVRISNQVCIQSARILSHP